MVTGSPLWGDNFYSANNQFIIETDYPLWEDYKDIFTTRFAQRSPYPDRTQYTINIEEVSDNLTRWAQDKVKTYTPITNLKVDQTWAIEYGDGGYQSVHNHTQKPQLLSMVMYFDSPRDKVQPTDGALFTLLPHPDGTQIVSQFHSYPGKTIIMDGRVYHGIYPGKQPRRCFVVNFAFDYLKPTEKST
tara:strand:- start:2773 stop:3336 length:564 start_codon:yes stop_codon:yes gene_type:complete